jgi:DNA-directed RNA polymerase specialized sigma subunit
MPAQIGSYTKSKLTPPESYVKWQQDPSEENHTLVLNSLKPTISSAVFSFAAGDQTLVPRATILASEALNTYDPKKGASLNTHVYNRLRRLQRFSAQRRQAVHIPENVRLDNGAVYRFTESWKEKHGVEPTVAQITDGTGLSVRRITKARGSGGERAQSQLTGEKGDLLVSKARSPQQIWADYVYHDLSDKDKKVFEWATGYGGSKILPKKEIAKNLGISAAAVSARVTKISHRLQEGM